MNDAEISGAVAALAAWTGTRRPRAPTLHTTAPRTARRMRSGTARCRTKRASPARFPLGDPTLSRLAIASERKNSGRVISRAATLIGGRWEAPIREGTPRCPATSAAPRWPSCRCCCAARRPSTRAGRCLPRTRPAIGSSDSGLASTARSRGFPGSQCSRVRAHRRWSLVATQPTSTPRSPAATRSPSTTSATPGL